MLFISTLPEHVRRLGDIDVFSGCTARELRRIDKLATTVTLPVGRVLCVRGDVGRECFVLIDGEVDVNLNGHHRTVGPTALVGEVALLTPGGRRTATVVAKTDVTVLAFNRAEFTQLIAAVPAVAHRILREATRRLVEDIDAG